MSKRFTDTKKWQDDWWGLLPNDHRIIWLYLVDNCSHAGIWKKDFRGLNFNCNTKITEQEFNKLFKDRIIDCGKFYFIPKFVKFQYPKGLKSDKPVIVSVRNELIENNLSKTIKQSLGNDYSIIKDKDKDKDKYKGGAGGKNGNHADASIKGIKFDKSKTKVLLSDKSWQQLGINQKSLVEIGELKADNIHKGDKH